MVLRWPVSLQYQQNDLSPIESSTLGDSCDGLGFPRNGFPQTPFHWLFAYVGSASF